MDTIFTLRVVGVGRQTMGCWTSLLLLLTLHAGSSNAQSARSMYSDASNIQVALSNMLPPTPGVQPLGCAIATTTSGGSWVLFADAINHRIRATPADGSGPALDVNVTVIGSAVINSSLPLYIPYSISTPPVTVPTPYAVVADYGNACIRYLDLAGWTPGGSPVDLHAIACGGHITSPSDTAIAPNGNIYIADPMSHTVLLYSPETGQVIVLAGTSGQPGFVDGTQAQFNQPLGLAIHPITGDLYVADWLNNAIRMVSTSTGLVSTIVGVPEDATPGFLDGPFATARINGPKTLRMVGVWSLAVSDSYNGAVRILDLWNQRTTTLFGNGTRSHTNGNTSSAAGSAVWGITGSLADR